jgi:hypothetical protein
VTITPITSDVAEPLNVLSDLPTQGTFDNVVLVDEACNLHDLRLGQLTGTGVRVDARLLNDVIGKLRTDTVDVPEGVPNLLLLWNVDACNTWHKSRSVLAPVRSALPLLQPRVLLVDDVPATLADHNLAVLGSSFDAALNFHGAYSKSYCL